LGEQGKFSEKIRTFSALFAIQENDPRLLPDLSAALDIVLQSSENTLVVPRGAVSRESSGDFVWLKTATGYDKHPVKLGTISDTGSRDSLRSFEGRDCSRHVLGRLRPGTYSMKFPWVSTFCNKYQLGSSTVFFVLDAQRQLAQAEFALAQARTSYQTAVAGIEHATGKLLGRHQVKLEPPHS
jgi:hypothetical protein